MASSSVSVIKDLTTDRSAFDKIMQSGGFVTARTGSAVDANEIPILKRLQIRQWMRLPASAVELV